MAEAVREDFLEEVRLGRLVTEVGYNWDRQRWGSYICVSIPSS